MSKSITSDNSLTAAKLALDGLTKRQEMIGNNLSNVDTPEYLAKKVNFESALQKQMGKSASLKMAKTHNAHMPTASSSNAVASVTQRQGGTLRADGNNVDIDVELMDLTETSLRFETLTTLINKKFGLLRDITSRR